MIHMYVKNIDNYVEYIVKSNLRNQDRKSVYNDRRAIIDRFLDVLDSGLIAIPSRLHLQTTFASCTRKKELAKISPAC